MPHHLEQKRLGVGNPRRALIAGDRRVEFERADRFHAVALRRHDQARAVPVRRQPEALPPAKLQREGRDDAVGEIEPRARRERKRTRPRVVPDVPGFRAEEPDVGRIDHEGDPRIGLRTAQGKFAHVPRQPVVQVREPEFPRRLIQGEEVLVEHPDLMRFPGQDLREDVRREDVAVGVPATRDQELVAGRPVVGELRDVGILRDRPALGDRRVGEDLVEPPAGDDKRPRAGPDPAAPADIDQDAEGVGRGNPRRLAGRRIERGFMLPPLGADLLDVEIDRPLTGRNGAQGGRGSADEAGVRRHQQSVKML